jgi:hypothetical protein
MLFFKRQGQTCCSRASPISSPQAFCDAHSLQEEDVLMSLRCLLRTWKSRTRNFYLHRGELG